MIKNIINSRLEEIIELLFLDCPLIKYKIFKNDLMVYFMGNGSKALNQNLLSFGSDFDFINEMSIIDETQNDYFNSALNFQKTTENFKPIQRNNSLENRGFFEKLFDYFTKN